MYVYSNICIYISVFYIHIPVKHLEDISGGGSFLLGPHIDHLDRVAVLCCACVCTCMCV